MGNFKRDGDRGGDRGGSRFGGPRGGGRDGGRPRFGNDRGPVTLHSAVCSKCGKTCEVPFRPVNGKPVYCKDCFDQMGMGGANERRDHNGRGGNDRGNDRFARPSFRDRAPQSMDSFGTNTPNVSVNSSNGEMKKQLELMNSKLDRLISALVPVIAPSEKPQVISVANEMASDVPAKEPAAKAAPKKSPKKAGSAKSKKQ